MAMDSRFPSQEHYHELKRKGFTGRISDTDLWAWHAYDYGWRRVQLQTREDRSPIDPDREWYNDKFAALAEIFYCRKLRRRAPDIEDRQRRRDPTEEEIAYVRRCVQETLANIRAFDQRNKATFNRFSTERDAIRRVHSELNIRAEETVEVGE